MRLHISSLIAAAAVSLALTSAPSAAFAQAKTITCKDGTTSSATGKGACSGHGGVDAAKRTASIKPATPAKSAKVAKSSSKTATNPPVATAAAVQQATPKKQMAAARPKAGDKDAAGATAECKDGTYSHAAGHAGACSKHGGVAKFLK